VRDFFWAAAVAPSVALRFRAISTPPMVALSRVAACGVEVSQWLRPHINFQRPTVTFALVIPVRPNSGLWLPFFDKSKHNHNHSDCTHTLRKANTYASILLNKHSEIQKSCLTTAATTAMAVVMLDTSTCTNFPRLDLHAQLWRIVLRPSAYMWTVD
jgi:hypothetical protein